MIAVAMVLGYLPAPVYESFPAVQRGPALDLADYPASNWSNPWPVVLPAFLGCLLIVLLTELVVYWARHAGSPDDSEAERD